MQAICHFQHQRFPSAHGTLPAQCDETGAARPEIESNVRAVLIRKCDSRREKIRHLLEVHRCAPQPGPPTEAHFRCRRIRGSRSTRLKRRDLLRGKPLGRHSRIAENLENRFHLPAKHHTFDAGKNSTLQTKLAGVREKIKGLRQFDVAHPLARCSEVAPASFVPNDSIHTDASAMEGAQLNSRRGATAAVQQGMSAKCCHQKDSATAGLIRTSQKPGVFDLPEWPTSNLNIHNAGFAWIPADPRHVPLISHYPVATGSALQKNCRVVEWCRWRDSNPHGF